MQSNSINCTWQIPDYMSQEKLKGNGVNIYVQPAKVSPALVTRTEWIWIGRKIFLKKRQSKENYYYSTLTAYPRYSDK